MLKILWIALNLQLVMVFVSCSNSSLSPYVESDLPVGVKPSIINSYISGYDYLIITAVDGVPVPKSSSYILKPGQRNIEMGAIYKGLEVDKMSYNVNIKGGYSYSLKPRMGKVNELHHAYGTIFKANDFMPLFIDDLTNVQLYPPTRKSKN